MGYKILSKRELCPNQYEITVDAPYVVRNARAGQFIIFRAEENGERVPLTIADVDKETGALALVNEVGQAKGWSSQKTDGDQVIAYILELRKQEKLPYHFAFLKRNGLAQEELGITNANYLLLPIPQQEIDYNYNMTQNPGY